MQVNTVPIDGDKETVREAVDQFISTFNTPIQEATRFYNLYFLSEIGDVDELEYQFTKLAQRLNVDFLNYAIYATYKEAQNFYSQFQIKGTTFNRYKRMMQGKGAELALQERFEEDRGKEFGKATMYDHKQWAKGQITDLLDVLRTKTNRQEWEVLEDLIKDEEERSMYAINKEEYKDVLVEAQQEFRLFSKPKLWLGAIEELFKMEVVITASRMNRTGWKDAFGGKAWASIARAANQYDDMPRTAWVDMMWSVQHNNNNFIDKVTTSPPVIEKLVREPWQNSVTGFPYDGLQLESKADIYKHVLPTYLYAARESKFKLLYETMLNINPRIKKYKDVYPNMDTVNYQEAIEVMEAG